MAKKKQKPIKIIYLKWLDHYSHKDVWGLMDYSATREGIPCETVGFLVDETKIVYRVALNYCFKKEGSESADTITIIKSCVIKKRFISNERRKKAKKRTQKATKKSCSRLSTKKRKIRKKTRRKTTVPRSKIKAAVKKVRR